MKKQLRVNRTPIQRRAVTKAPAPVRVRKTMPVVEAKRLIEMAKNGNEHRFEIVCDYLNTIAMREYMQDCKFYPCTGLATTVELAREIAKDFKRVATIYQYGQRVMAVHVDGRAIFDDSALLNDAMFPDSISNEKAPDA